MAHLIELKDGSLHTIFDLPEVLRLIDEYMGDEIRRWLEDYLEETNEDAEYIDYLEKENEKLKAHHREVMETLQKQSEQIASIIQEKEIDRKSLSNAAGIISTTTWREICVR